MNASAIKDLDLIKELKTQCPTFDMHLHPLDIFSISYAYARNGSNRELFHLDRRPFNPPQIKTLEKLDLTAEVDESLNTNPKAIKLLNRLAYSHSGPSVFRSHFHLAGLEMGLLLPVAPEHGDFRRQMDQIYNMFREDRRFFMATCVPNAVKDNQLVGYLLEEKKRYGVIALKIHPNVTNIDIRSRSGKKRIVTLLHAGAEVNLPVIIHTGMSFIPSSGQVRNTDIADYLDIDIPDAVPVILAHGGCYGHTLADVESFILPHLNRILSRNSNVFIDVSGLEIPVLQALLNSVDTRRILFGSDGLYVMPAAVLLKMIFAIRKSDRPLEASLVSILSKNPAKSVFKDALKEKYQDHPDNIGTGKRALS